MGKRGKISDPRKESLLLYECFVQELKSYELMTSCASHWSFIEKTLLKSRTRPCCGHQPVLKRRLKIAPLAAIRIRTVHSQQHQKHFIQRIPLTSANHHQN